MKENFKNRPFSAAGQFYPEDKKILAGKLEKLMNTSIDFNGRVFGLLLPHASYELSGEVAAKGIKSVQGEKFDTVIIISDSHYEYFKGISLWPEGEWETPLGKIKIDEKMAKSFLSSSKNLVSKQSPHIFDHTIEVQLPFLQNALGKFKLLPLSLGSEKEDLKELARIILDNIKDKKILIIVSSDLSHYLSSSRAEEADRKVLEAVASLDGDLLEEKIVELEKEKIPGLETFLCSKDSVKVLMEIARAIGGRAEVLGYVNSGDFLDDKSKVVGYGAVAFYK
jgi:hypothetical protein